MESTKFFFVIALCALALVVSSGCIGGKSETVTIEKGFMYSYSFEMPEETEVMFSLDTDGAPVDVLVLDRANFEVFQKIFSGGGDGRVSTIVTHPGVVSKSFTFTSPKDDTYYIVIENSDWLKGGATATRAVRVTTRSSV